MDGTRLRSRLGPAGRFVLTVISLPASEAIEIGATVARWDGCSVFHHPEWLDVIRATYGHETEYLVARAGGEIVGVFPVTVVRHPLLGTKMVAMPYQFHSGSPVCCSDEARTSLVQRALASARGRGAAYLEVRHHAPAPFLEDLGFVHIDSQLVLTEVRLADFSETRLRRNHRRNIRSGRELGVEIVEDGSATALRRFQRMYLRESRALGSPRAGWNFFANLHALASSFYRLYHAHCEGAYIGGLLCLDDGRTVFARDGVYSSPEALSRHAGHLLYCRALSDAAEGGRVRFNCGISWVGDGGLIHWKEGWGGVTSPAHVYVYPIRGHAPAPGNYFSGFNLAKAVWRRLPLWAVEHLGRRVTRWIG